MKTFKVTLYFEVDNLDMVDELEKTLQANSPETAVRDAARGEWFDFGGGVYVPRERLTSVRVEEIALAQDAGPAEGDAPCGAV